MLQEADGDCTSGFNPPVLVAKYAEQRRRIATWRTKHETSTSTGEESKMADEALLLRVTHTMLPIETVRCLATFVAQLSTPLMHLR